MPRTQRKRLGSRQYANYSPETLNECLQNVISRKMTQREAAEKGPVVDCMEKDISSGGGHKEKML